MDEQKGYLFDMKDADAHPAVSGTESFSVRPGEAAAALLMYAAAYLYSAKVFFGNWEKNPWFLCFSVLFLGITELICLGVERSRESILWAGCLLTIALGLSFDFSRIGLWSDSVWDFDQLMLFLHLSGVWYVLSRSGKLLDGESGHLAPMDLLDGFMIFPFGNFFLRLKVLFAKAKSLFSKKAEHKPNSWLWIFFAIVLAGLLLNTALRLLTEADSGFSRLMQRLQWSLNFRWNGAWSTYVSYFVLSLPIGAYLYGLIAGGARTEKSVLEGRKNSILSLLRRLRNVPDALWITVIAVFSLFYLVFFVLQGEYLFGAFIGKLPEGFIVSQYARQGFFELCKLITLNFSLLWLVTRSSRTSARDGKLLRLTCLGFLAESMLFCIIAFSKILLYIDCYGFTPLRLQSSWLVCVLFAACVLWCIEIVTDKKVFRTWMYLSAISLSLLALI